MSFHEWMLIAFGGSLGVSLTAVGILIRDVLDTDRTINAWLEYEKEEQKSWKETKTQKERKAHAPWN